jgi:hypothetical protein
MLVVFEELVGGEWATVFLRRLRKEQIESLPLLCRHYPLVDREPALSQLLDLLLLDEEPQSYYPVVPHIHDDIPIFFISSTISPLFCILL